MNHIMCLQLYHGQNQHVEKLKGIVDIRIAMGGTHGVEWQDHLIFDAVLLAKGLLVLEISQCREIIG